MSVTQGAPQRGRSGYGILANSVHAEAQRLLLVLLALLNACGSTVDEATPALASSTVDSAGVQVVVSVAPTPFERPWQLDASRRVELGRGESAQVLFHRVQRAVGVPNGGTAVLTADPPEILSFDQAGRLARRFGRLGGGPGEFRQPYAMRFTAPDTISVWDAQLGPLVAFDTSGRHLATRHFDLPRLLNALGDSLITESHVPMGSGLVLLRASQRSGAPLSQGLVENHVTFVLLTESYAALPFGRYAAGQTHYGQSGKQRVVVSPFIFVQALAIGGGAPWRAYLASGNRYAIDVKDSQGALVRIVRKDAPALKWDDDRFAQMRDSWLKKVRGMYPREDPEALLAKLPDQRIIPPILDLVLDSENHLWVRENRTQWSIFDPHGVWRASLEVPLLRVYDIGKDFIIGLARDDDDAEYVVRLGLDRGGP